VTGASRGIGRGIALSLARQGYGLTVTSRKSADLEPLGAELLLAGAGHVVTLARDMADRGALPDLVQLHGDTYGAMHALIVNAGVGTGGRLIDFDLRRLNKTLDVNFTSAVVLIQAALPLLRRGADADPAHGARIIGLSSITGAYAEAGLALYGASKAALISLLETVNLEEAPQGVLATAIAPGYVATDMSEWITHEIPAATMIQVEDVVAVVNMLLQLTRNASISKVVLARSSSRGYSA
jgi:3-oxoacyl-[acyl-carrier protein] reductase